MCSLETTDNEYKHAFNYLSKSDLILIMIMIMIGLDQGRIKHQKARTYVLPQSDC